MLPDQNLLKISPLEGCFGAEICDIDLTEALSQPELMSAIERGFVEHHVLSVRGQALDVDSVVEISRCMGELEPHVLRQYHHPQTPLVLVLSNRIDADGRPLGLKDAGSFWHSDVSFKERPARATVLYAVEVPERGGDTLFCDMMAAYQALPKELKTLLDDKFALHDYAQRDRVAHLTGTVPRLDSNNLSQVPPVRHPVIRRHPVSGRRAIYVNPTYTVRIEGVSDESSRALLDEIFAHSLQDRFCMRYRWRPGDLVIWDNAAVMHSATTQHLDPELHRTLWRTIVLGGPTS